MASRPAVLMLASSWLNCVTMSEVLDASVTAAAGVIVALGPVGPVGPVGPGSPDGPAGPVGPGIGHIHWHDVQQLLQHPSLLLQYIKLKNLQSEPLPII